MSLTKTGFATPLSSSASGISQAQLGEQVPLPRTTLYRIIATLIDRGMIRRDPTRKVYRLGFKYLEMVRNAYLEPDLVSSASEELRALRDLTGETSYLAVLDGNQVLSLERCDGAHTQRSASQEQAQTRQPAQPAPHHRPEPVQCPQQRHHECSRR